MKLSLIIPTYNEKDNINKLILDIEEEFNQNGIDGEIIIVDDNSPDGTGDIVEALKSEYINISIIHRQGKLGLSSAVIEGFGVALGDIWGVMDADLSHPVVKIHEMYQAILGGADMVVGSRHVKGGDILGWGLRRKLLSKGATLLAGVFTSVRDPMSGFFMFRKEHFVKEEISPKGFKILLELLVKIKFENIVEVPIVFINRTMGKSKADTGEIIYYLENIIKYLPYKKDTIMQFVRFAMVGVIGTFVNIFILYLLTEYYNIYYMVSAFFGFIVAATINFILNKIWTFGESLKTNLTQKYAQFFIVSLIALTVNIIFLYIFTEYFKVYYIVSQIIAIGLSLIINFIGNKIWTFRK